MEMIRNLIINNYKSIKSLRIECSRINLFIGEPNTGKSNILEALDLSYLSWMLSTNQSLEKAGIDKIDIGKFFRANTVSDLFYLGDISKPVEIIHPGFSTGSTTLSFRATEDINRPESSNNFFEWTPGHNGITAFDNHFQPQTHTQFYGSPIKPYRYKDNITFHDTGNYLNNLMPPFGNNLPNVIKFNRSFQDFLENVLAESGIEINIDSSTGNLAIQLRLNEKLVHSLSYEAMAETLKRLFFYVAAIRYNNAFVITLDEPDVHAFPKYVSFIADEIIANRKDQFFITTHNPYLLNNFIENTPEGQLSVFVCSYDKEAGTNAKKLSQEDLSELLDYGVDIFFNINRYLDDRVEHSS